MKKIDNFSTKLMQISNQQYFTSFNMSTFLSISSRLGGDNAMARMALGSPRSRTFT